jgi:hypothetical protein
LWQKVNNTVGLTGKLKAVATAAFLGDSGLMNSKVFECCKSGTDFAVFRVCGYAATALTAAARAVIPRIGLPAAQVIL